MTITITLIADKQWDLCGDEHLQANDVPFVFDQECADAYIMEGLGILLKYCKVTQMRIEAKHRFFTVICDPVLVPPFFTSGPDNAIKVIPEDGVGSMWWIDPYREGYWDGYDSIYDNPYYYGTWAYYEYDDGWWVGDEDFYLDWYD